MHGHTNVKTRGDIFPAAYRLQMGALQTSLDVSGHLKPPEDPKYWFIPGNVIGVHPVLSRSLKVLAGKVTYIIG